MVGAGRFLGRRVSTRRLHFRWVIPAGVVMTLVGSAGAAAEPTRHAPEPTVQAADGPARELVHRAQLDVQNPDDAADHPLTPFLGGALEDVLGPPSNGGDDALGGLLGALLGAGAPTAASTIEIDEQNLTFAATCRNPDDFGFLFEPLARAVVNGAEIGAAFDLDKLKAMLKPVLVMARQDPCLMALALQAQALVGVLEGRYAQAARVMSELLRPLGSEPGAWSLVQRAILAGVLAQQRRFDEALVLQEEVERHVAEVFGPASGMTLAVRGQRADVLLQMAETTQLEGRAEAAQESLQQSLAIFREVGQAALAARPENRDVGCIASAREAEVLVNLRQLDEARQRLSDNLDPNTGRCGTHLEDDHPWLADTRRLLGIIELDRGNLDAAEVLLDASRAADRSNGLDAHPDFVASTRALAELKAQQGHDRQAAALLGEMNEALLGWLGNEIRVPARHDAARRIAGAQALHQETALLVALAMPDSFVAQGAAALSVIRFKGLRGEEDAVLAGLARQTSDLRIRELAEEVARLRSDLAAAYRANPLSFTGEGPTEALRRELSDAESALARASGLFQRQLRVREVDLAEIRGAFDRYGGGGATLVEFRRVTGRALGRLPSTADLERWTAVVIGPEDIRVVDLGPAGPVDDLLAQLRDPILNQVSRARNQVGPAWPLGRVQAAIYERLVQPLRLDVSKPMVLAPDGALHGLPFWSLREVGGRYWVENPQLRLRVVSSGRKLVADGDPAPSGVGLLAVGGVAFGETPGGERAVRKLRPLPESGREVEAIAAAYRRATGEAATVLTGEAAKEGELNALEAAPRVLHLATHGLFDRRESDAVERPLLVTAVALAGAERMLSRPDEADSSTAQSGANDGLLHAIEAQNLALDGTRLVALSACETALGVFEVGEGVHGLTRAFRTAGARNIVAAVRPIDDRDARAVMEVFYRHWLAQPDQSIAGAFAATAREFIATGDQVDWTAFNVIGLE